MLLDVLSLILICPAITQILRMPSLNHLALCGLPIDGNPRADVKIIVRGSK